MLQRNFLILDTELYKFKCELEADNKGITEVLEKRSLELDAPQTIVPTTPTSHQNKDSRCTNCCRSASIHLLLCVIFQQ